MSKQEKCECENVCHFDANEGSPNGNPGHLYGIKFYGAYMRTVRTSYGEFRVCKDCAEDCLAVNPINGERR